ncbi:Uncharacterized protein APZ42_024753 [Daphnia magna]|uniref:RNA-directed DNA polymerase n=1 Tax=Daphnia magna TaxID=35525 RepID=A0A164TT77_9CRUS|nr:Uncharacterized protein APZ42_024753 [Daphnia magna]
MKPGLSLLSTLRRLLDNSYYDVTIKRICCCLLQRIRFKNQRLGNTGLVKHVMETQGLGPIRQRLYRASPNQKEISKKIIEELLANNIIRPSLSSWAAPIVLVHDRKNQPIAYASYYLNKAEVYYSTIEKKAAVVILGKKRFRHYLQDEPFVIVTAPRANDTMIREQQKDSPCSDIRDYLENGTFANVQEEATFVQTPKIVPLSLTKSLLQEYHESQLSGHLAYQRTLLRLRDQYYWLTMLSDINEYCLACEPCDLQLRSNLRAFLKPLDITFKPFELLGLVHTPTPLEKTLPLFRHFAYSSIPVSTGSIAGLIPGDIRLFVTSLLALSFLAPSVASNGTVCNCDNVANLGFLKITKESALIKPPLHHRHPLYAVYFTLLEIKRFARPTSSMWEVITAVCKDFLQWNQVSQSRKLIDVDEVMCCRMRDSRQCRGKAMDIIGLNTVALEVYPFV